jgi:hypothetical protein
VTSLCSPTCACSFPETTDLYYLVNRGSSTFRPSDVVWEDTALESSYSSCLPHV